MATLTTGYSWTSGDTITPALLNQTVNSATISGIVNADIDASAAISMSKMSSSAQQSFVPAGAVMPFAMNSAPAGWLAADGAAVSRSTYATLFAAVGTVHGAGNGSTTFNLPDLRGYFVRGAGTNGDGAAAGTFAEKVADSLKSHTHTVTDPGHFHVYGAPSSPTASSGSGGNSQVDTVVALQTLPAVTGITIAATGDAETKPKNIALLYCVKF